MIDGHGNDGVPRSLPESDGRGVVRSALRVRTLHLLRHAKSDWSDGTLPDRDRPLNKRGRRARLLVAEHVRGWPVALAVCSPALRARDTAQPVVEALGCRLVTDAAIYEATVGELFGVVQRLPDEAAEVLVVGHNPGMEGLTAALCGTSARFPTAALASIRLDLDHWADLRFGSGELISHVTPRSLGETR